jgi:hypothetical protein
MIETVVKLIQSRRKPLDKTFDDISGKHSECFLVCLEPSDDTESKQTAKVFIDLKKDSTLRQILPKLVADAMKQTQR